MPEVEAKNQTQDASPIGDRLCSASLILTAVGVAFLVIRNAVTRGLLTDELLFVHAIELGLKNSLMAPGSSHPPLLRILVSAIADPATSADWLLRLPSIVAAVGVVYVWHRILSRVVSPVLHALLLPAMAFNPFWVEQSFQCLPYSLLVFASSCYCLAWLKAVERDFSFGSCCWLVGTGCLLPWTHFFGVNLLVATQLIWVALLFARQLTIRKYVFTNLATALLTLPVVPIAIYYVVHDRNYPLAQITDFGDYFVEFSSYCFSTVTFGTGWTMPAFGLLYVAAAVFVLLPVIRHFLLKRAFRVEGFPEVNSTSWKQGLVLVAFFLGGFAAAQSHSFISQTAMWPRYMLGGSWSHLPLLAVLLVAFRLKPAAWALSVAALFTVASGLNAAGGVGHDYADIANHIRSRQTDHDAFLAQSIDLWQVENQFDRLWAQRYLHDQLTFVTGFHRSRIGLQEGGLSLAAVPSRFERVWVYSHLFKEAWLDDQRPAGWRLAELKSFGGPFPVALFERTPEEVTLVKRR